MKWFCLGPPAEAPTCGSLARRLSVEALAQAPRGWMRKGTMSILALFVWTGRAAALVAAAPAGGPTGPAVSRRRRPVQAVNFRARVNRRACNRLTTAGGGYHLP